MSLVLASILVGSPKSMWMWIFLYFIIYVVLNSMQRLSCAEPFSFLLLLFDCSFYYIKLNLFFVVIRFSLILLHILICLHLCFSQPRSRTMYHTHVLLPNSLLFCFNLSLRLLFCFCVFSFFDFICSCGGFRWFVLQNLLNVFFDLLNEVEM